MTALTKERAVEIAKECGADCGHEEDRLVLVWPDEPHAAMEQYHREACAGDAEAVAWWIPKAEQFCLAKKSGERPFVKAWEPLFARPDPQVAGLKEKVATLEGKLVKAEGKITELENNTRSCLSWRGFNLFGDIKSISEANRLLHESEKVPYLMERIAELENSAQSCTWAKNTAGFYKSSCGRTLCSLQSDHLCQYCGKPIKVIDKE